MKVIKEKKWAREPALPPRWAGPFKASSFSDFRGVLALFRGSILEPHWWLSWKTWAPLRIKIFSWLTLQGCCWTVDRLARHSLSHDEFCVLRDHVPEYMHHLLVGCSLSRQVQDMRFFPGVDPRLRHLIQCSLSRTSGHPLAPTPPPRTVVGSPPSSCSQFGLWKHCNDCIFDG